MINIKNMNPINGIPGDNGLYMVPGYSRPLTGSEAKRLEVLGQYGIDGLCEEIFGLNHPYFVVDSLGIQPYITRAFDIKTLNDIQPAESLWRMCIVPTDVNSFSPEHLRFIGDDSEIQNQSATIVLVNSENSQLNVTELFRLFLLQYGDSMSFESFLNQFIVQPLVTNPEKIDPDRPSLIQNQNITVPISGQNVPQTHLFPATGIVLNIKPDGNIVFTVNGQPTVSPPYIGQEGPLNFNIYNFLAIYSQSLVPANTDVQSTNRHLSENNNDGMTGIFIAAVIVTLIGAGFLKAGDISDAIRARYGKKDTPESPK